MRRKNYIDIPDHARRNFIKWTAGLGAALGLRPWKVFEVQESLVGPAVAAEASCAAVNRYVGNIMGNGGFAWMTQLWPHIEQATRGGQTAFYATGQATQQSVDAAVGDHPMPLGPAAPFKNHGKKITAFMAGSNQTHTAQPDSSANIGTARLYAAVALMQTASQSLVPAISVGTLPYGQQTVPGSPALASVPNPAGMVDLFNSASSTAGGALASANDAALFDAYYKANLSLYNAAARPTLARGFLTGKIAANLLGRNLANQLRPSAADLIRYGVAGGDGRVNKAPKLASIASTLITTAKAFKLNLTNSVIQPGMQDDPHGAFGNMTDLVDTVNTLGKIWSAFMDDLMAEPDPLCAGAKLGDNVIITWTGDTAKAPYQQSGWPDGTPRNSNWIYVLGNGWIKSGWFGQVKGDGSVDTWNPATGENAALAANANVAGMAGPAGAAVLYGIARGDMRRVNEVFRGEIGGVVIPKLI